MSRSNCQHDTCKIGMSYAEGSRWNAYEAVDKCYVAGPHETPLMASKPHMDGEPMNPKHAADLAFDMTFGCQTLVTGLFKTQLADGIMGMSNQMSTFWSQMFRAEKMGDEQKFALCFSRPPLIKREGTEAGAMTLGGFDQRLHSSPMVYTPDFDKGRSSFFSVKIRSMMLRDGKFRMSAKSNSKNPNEGVKHLLTKRVLSSFSTKAKSYATLWPSKPVRLKFNSRSIKTLDLNPSWPASRTRMVCPPFLARSTTYSLAMVLKYEEAKTKKTEIRCCETRKTFNKSQS